MLPLLLHIDAAGFQVSALALGAALPLAMMVAARLGRDRPWPGPFRRWRDGYRRATPAVRLAAALMLASAGVHLAIVPGHGPVMAAALLLDGLLLIVAATAAFLIRRWRWPAVVLLLATVLAYVAAVGGRREAPDQIGALTKLVELTALTLVLAPGAATIGGWRRGLRWTAATAALFLLTLLTGVALWSVALQPDAVAARGAGNAPIFHWASVAGPPTPDQQAAAARLLAETRAGIARYADPATALSDGYRATMPGGATIHYENQSYSRDGRVLDPERPEQLVYAMTDDGLLLLGAGFVMPRAGVPGPEVGGPLTRWHAHTVCVSALPPGLAGLVSPFGTCPAATLNVQVPFMMHVWIVDNPGGPFADNAPPASQIQGLRR